MKKTTKLGTNGVASLRANLPKVFTDHLEWTKDTTVEIELKKDYMIIRKKV